jgi:hypothetical protein
MALNKAAKNAPQIFTTANSNPNTAKIKPGKVGDICVDTTLMTLYFCKGLTGTNDWGTAGTA